MEMFIVGAKVAVMFSSFTLTSILLDVLVAKGRAKEFAKQVTGSANQMRQIVDSVKVTEKSEREFKKGSLRRRRDNYWQGYKCYLIKIGQVDATRIVNILCNIEYYARHGKCEYQLPVEDKLAKDRLKFFLQKGYKISEEGTVISW